MNRMQEKYSAQGLVIIGVNMDANPGDAEAFLREYPAQFTIVADPGGDLARHFDVEAMPSSYIIGRDGAVVATHMGFQVKKSDEYEEKIRQVLSPGED
jgi:peroxiredoxin